MSKQRINAHALRAFRLVIGKTQKMLAEEVGADHTTVSRWENGERLGVTADVLARLAEVLRVPADALIAAELAPNAEYWKAEATEWRKRAAQAERALEEIRSSLIRLSQKHEREADQ